jgi:hypothetical protein
MLGFDHTGPGAAGSSEGISTGAMATAGGISAAADGEPNSLASVAYLRAPARRAARP